MIKKNQFKGIKFYNYGGVECEVISITDKGGLCYIDLKKYKRLKETRHFTFFAFNENNKKIFAQMHELEQKQKNIREEFEKLDRKIDNELEEYEFSLQEIDLHGKEVKVS